MSYGDTDDVEDLEDFDELDDYDELDDLDEYIFCESCGARLYATDRTCPKCGRPAPGILSTRSAAPDLAAGKTASFPRLSADGADFSKKMGSAPEIITNSFDPSETTVLDQDKLKKAARKGKRKQRPRKSPQEMTEADFRKPRRWRWVLLALLVVIVAGGVYFVVEDPMGVMPGVYEDFAEAAAEAFPSRYEDVEETEVATAGSSAEESAGTDAAEGGEETEILEETLSDAEVYTKISALYEEIVDFQDELDVVVDDYNGWYIANDYSQREEASESAYTMRDHVQEVLDELDALVLADDSVYTEDVEHLVQLATWMYNRVNVLCESWDISLGLGEDAVPSDYRSEIVKPLTEALDADGVNQDVVQYETYLYEWEPVEKDS